MRRRRNSNGATMEEIQELEEMETQDLGKI